MGEKGGSWELWELCLCEMRPLHVCVACKQAYFGEEEESARLQSR